jgi:hypothetical protein
MKNHVELFRAISSISPELGEQLIMSWGSVDLHLLIIDMINGRDKRIGSALSQQMTLQLSQLEQEHRQTFPQFAKCSAEVVPDALATDQSYRDVRAKFPHIGQKISITWGTPKFYAYIESLLNAGDRVDRQGLPNDIGTALSKIFQKHDELFPQTKPKQIGAWSDVSI